MFQPVTLTWALLWLLSVTAAQAQALTARSRRITVAASPSEPLPEVRVAVGVKTTLLLDGPIDKGSIQVGAARVRIVDAGESSLTFEPQAPPGGDKERWVLRVRYAEGARPEWAAFALVAHPTEVDLQVEAVRPTQPLQACQAQLAAAEARCEQGRAEVWVLADRLGGHPVQAQAFATHKAQGAAYRLGEELLLVFKPKPEAGPPWTPTAATLRSLAAPKEEVKVRAVHVRPGKPGEWGSVAVEAELPSPAAGHKFDLELRGESGQSLQLKEVRIPLAPAEKETRQ
jgi:uncharacterized protein (TIGR02268 family)